MIRLLKELLIYLRDQNTQYSHVWIVVPLPFKRKKIIPEIKEENDIGFKIYIQVQIRLTLVREGGTGTISF